MVKTVHFKTKHSVAEIAYLAGIIDGEGCIDIGHTKQGKYGNGYQWHSMLKVTSCDEELIIWLENTFGGQRDSRYRWTSKKAFTRPVYNWQATGLMLDYLLPLVKPYLIIKKKQCEIMIRYRLTSKNIGSKRLSAEINQQRFELLGELRNLNSRFHAHSSKKSFAIVILMIWRVSSSQQLLSQIPQRRRCMQQLYLLSFCNQSVPTTTIMLRKHNAQFTQRHRSTPVLGRRAA